MRALGLITAGPKPYLTVRGTAWCGVLWDIYTWGGNVDCLLEADGQSRH